MHPKLNERHALVKKGEKGKDVLVDEILDNPSDPRALFYEKAEALAAVRVKKHFVEASILCSRDWLAIGTLLEIDAGVIEAYADFFYNVEGYDKLDKLDLVGKSKDKDEITLKTWALHQGLEFIAWRLGKHINISPIDGLSDLFNTCMYKSKEAVFNGNSSNASIESTKWVKLSLDIARLLKLWVMDSESAKKDLQLAISEIVPDFPSLDLLISESEVVKNEDMDEDKE